jgi:NitT/TauT family transport system substrate-binding protein
MPCVFVICVFIESSPQQIIAEGTDWRFFNELKRELKA